MPQYQSLPGGLLSSLECGWGHWHVQNEWEVREGMSEDEVMGQEIGRWVKTQARTWTLARWMGVGGGYGWGHGWGCGCGWGEWELGEDISKVPGICEVSGHWGEEGEDEGYEGKVKITLDVASSEFYKDSKYDLISRTWAQIHPSGSWGSNLLISIWNWWRSTWCVHQGSLWPGQLGGLDTFHKGQWHSDVGSQLDGHKSHLDQNGLKEKACNGLLLKVRPCFCFQHLILGVKPFLYFFIFYIFIMTYCLLGQLPISDITYKFSLRLVIYLLFECSLIPAWYSMSKHKVRLLLWG